MIVTRTADRRLVIALWNLVDPGATGSAKTFRLIFDNVPNDAPVTVSRVDNDHGNTLAAYKAMGSPLYPAEDQVRRLNAATELPPPTRDHLAGNHLDLNLHPDALVLVEMKF